jgi:serine/threonine protein kinase/tetratricopeptide (TPR) repeat protein
MQPAMPARLGDFEVVRELGRGGMGVVYEAVQVSLGRRVALKVLAGGLGLTPRAVERFRREAGAAAKLHHTNIVPVYATGEQDGTHFYAMELIEGQSLDQVIGRMRPDADADATSPADSADRTGPYHDGAATPDPGTGLSSSSLGSGSGYFDAVARMVAEVADALDYAHKAGVVHRDIKPSNLLVSPAGRLSVNDFGLARVLEQPGVTATGEFVGTPAYMSPEQITAGRIPLDHRTDVYSLGATLYEMLTLRRPFAGERRDQVLAQIVQKEPAPPRRLNRKVPPDLETICLKALEKDPDRRYQTAGAMADDLRRYVNRFAISAKRAGPLTKLRKWVRRNPALTAAGFVVVLAGSAVGFFAWRADQAERQRVADEQRRDDERVAEKRRAAIERGMVAAMATDLGAAERAVAEAELLGASPAEVRFLRGFIALHLGKEDEAVEHLRQAAQLAPESVAARASLSYAYMQVGSVVRAEKALAEARALPAGDPQDRLFLGVALGQFAPEDGLPLIEAALRDRPSNVGAVFRADLRWSRAMDTGTLADAETAVDEAETACRLLPGSVYALSIRTHALMVAAEAYRREGRADRRDEMLTRVGRDADALAAFPDSPMAVVNRWAVGDYRAGLSPDFDATAGLTHTGPASAGDPIIANFKAQALFRLGRDAEALALLDADPASRASEFRVLVAAGSPGGRLSAFRDLERTLDTIVPVHKPLFLLSHAGSLFVLDRGDRVPDAAREIRASGTRLFRDSAADHEVLLTFLEGRSSGAEFLAAPASNRPVLARRQLLVAMKRLGAGDRAGAEVALRATYDLGAFQYTPWFYAKALLIRMARDPSWPPWIPVKE